MRRGDRSRRVKRKGRRRRRAWQKNYQYTGKPIAYSTF